MPIKTEIVADDGLHRVTRTTIAKPRGRADFEAIVAMFQASAQAATFEGAIGDAERYWRTVPEDPRPTPLSKAWYRARILEDVAWSRLVFSEGLAPGNLEYAIVRALTLGATIEEAVWRFGLGPAARIGGRVRRKNRAASQRASTTRKAEAATRDRSIRAAAAAYRRRHPSHSLRTLARNLAPDLALSESTIRRRLRQKKTA